MADMDYFGADYGAEEPSRLAEAARNFGLVNWAGALTSLGLTAGMAVWAVNMTFRDVSGVPVIAALEGPMRVAPENPGGRVAPFQGMALSDITSGGPAAPAPDQIVLAPPPVELDAAPLGERLAAAGHTPQMTASEIAAPDLAVQTVVAQATDLIATPAVALASDVAELQVTPLGDLNAPVELISASAPATLPETPPVIAPETPVAAVAATVRGVVRTERPRLRPARRVAAVATPAVATDAAPVQTVSADATAIREVAPGDVAPGTRVVQLGAFDSEALARGEWERLYGRFGDFMEGKSRMIQKARSGGRDFWRLRVVGFDDASDARRFCSTLLARDAACIPVTMR
ncbi:MAG: SPOR domain-containing protein [Pseudomonadota bacterium]